MPTLLPNARQQFVDLNGAPYAGGLVYFYVPGTTTYKDTYQDTAGQTLNTNPVILDAAGQAVIYGTGAYRQVLKDALGNLIWDLPTADTAAITTSWVGTAGGTANAIALTAPNFSSVDGQAIDFIAAFTPTGPFSVSINGTAVPVKVDGAAGPATVGAGSITAGNVYRLTYDATGGFAHLTPVADPGAIGAQIAAGDAATLASAQAYAQGQAGSALSQAETFANTGDSQTLSQAQTYAQGQAGSALSQAETFANTGDAQTLASARTYAANQAASALSQANTYTDGASATAASTYVQGVRMSGVFTPGLPYNRSTGQFVAYVNFSPNSLQVGNIQYNINGTWVNVSG